MFDFIEQGNIEEGVKKFLHWNPRQGRKFKVKLVRVNYYAQWVDCIIYIDFETGNVKDNLEWLFTISERQYV